MRGQSEPCVHSRHPQSPYMDRRGDVWKDVCPPPLMSAPSLGKQNPRSRGWGATPSLSLPSSPERQPLPASIRSSTHPSTHQQLTHRGPSGNTEMTHVCSWNQAGVTLSLRTRPLTMHGSLFHRRCSRAPCGAKGPPLSTFGLFRLASSVCGLFTRLQTRAGVCALRLTCFRPLPDAPRSRQLPSEAVSSARIHCLFTFCHENAFLSHASEHLSCAGAAAGEPPPDSGLGGGSVTPAAGCPSPGCSL